MDKKRKSRTGVVVSDKMQKTVVVAVKTPQRHPIYKKVITKVTKFKAHCEKSDCKEGDEVRIVETRPLSREKRWRVTEVITRGKLVGIKPTEIS